MEAVVAQAVDMVDVQAEVEESVDVMIVSMDVSRKMALEAREEARMAWTNSN
jgi:hypothetical protein